LRIFKKRRALQQGMKIYVFTDPHGNTKALSQMQKNVKSEKPDLLICTGDLTIFESNMKKLLKEIEKLKVPTLMLHGNHETEESLRKTCEKLQHITFLHKELFEMKGYTFAAYGGGGFDQKDTELEQQFKTWKNLNWKKTIFLSHAPPYKTAMDDVGEFDEAWHVGSKSLRKMTKKYQPLMLFVGHIHEGFDMSDTINKTLVENPGPIGKAYILEEIEKK
jgi:Icc-related predicted phosphoesterase